MTRSLAVLVAAVGLAGLAVLAVCGLSWAHEDGALLAALAALAVLSEVADFAPFPHVRVSLSVALIMAAATVAGPPGVAVVASVAVVGDYVVHRKAWYKVVFNEGTLLLAGGAYLVVLEGFAVSGPGDWPSALAAGVVGSAASFAVNSGLVALAVGLDSGRRPQSVWRDGFSGLLPHYVLLGVLAVAMASAYDGWGLAGLSIVIAPLAMVWVALKQYTDRARAAPPVPSA